MFLLGAVLVGGVLGFSADRVAVHFRDKNEVQSRIERSSWMDALGLDQIQRSHVEAILDSTNCRVLLLTAPLEPVIDSVRRLVSSKCPYCIPILLNCGNRLSVIGRPH
jgi:hypothetical protein